MFIRVERGYDIAPFFYIYNYLYIYHMQWLDRVSKHHEEYIKYVRKMGATSHAEDIVQEMYLLLHKYNCEKKVIRENGNVNKSYIWRTLYNLFILYKRNSKKFTMVDIDEHQYLFNEELNEQKEQAYEKIITKVEAHLNELDETGYPYNKELFKMYVNTGLSMRGISRETNISLRSIFYTLSKCKDELAEEIREDLEDYKNEEYERI